MKKTENAPESIRLGSVFGFYLANGRGIGKSESKGLDTYLENLEPDDAGRDRDVYFFAFTFS